MGVHGLWRLIDASGKPVPLETLENKVLAVDISIWLHQAVKGFQDNKGGSVPNAHLLGLYHRLCKLLFFKIKPVFVFDGGVPVLKRQTMAKRTQAKLKTVTEADRLQKQLLSVLVKHAAISNVLQEKLSIPKPPPSRGVKDDMYILPSSSEMDSTISSSEDESSYTSDSSPSKQWDLHKTDVNSSQFKSLPVDVRHDILTDLKETRKQNSWGRLHELPTVSDDFSLYQMKRLLKRQAVQAALEEAEKEMGGKSLSLAELENILHDQGVITSDLGKRIASDNSTKYLLVKDVQKAIEEAKKREQNTEASSSSKKSEADVEYISTVTASSSTETSFKSKADLEYEEDMQTAIALSLSAFESTVSQETCNISSDDEEEIAAVKQKMSSAQSYMMEYSGLTPNEISKIISAKGEQIKKPKVQKPVLPVVVEAQTEEVSFMSTSSDDSEHEDGKVLNILINPSAEFNEEEDLFADVFDGEKGEKSTKLESSKAFSIVVNPEEGFNGEDDLFSDVFNEDALSGSKKESSQVKLKDGQEASQERDSTIPHEATDDSCKRKIEVVNDEEICKRLKSKEATSISDQLTILTPQSKDNVLEAQEEYITIQNEKTPKDGSSSSEHSTSSAPVKVSEETLRNLKHQLQKVQEDLAINRDRDSIKNHLPEEQASSSTQSTSSAPEVKVSKETLRNLKDQLQEVQDHLVTKKSTKERMAANITDQMYQEAQELLQLFGVPYIVAPMEAEAQCAFLDAIGLTDGTITDDSDIWLFGGRTVYKNFFNQNKLVMEYRADQILQHYKLSREQMVLLALLVGSDYTVGLQGVGPVTALEVLAAFPPPNGTPSAFELISGLKAFRSWLTKGKSPGPGRASLKGKLKNVVFVENFPSLQVVQAYLDPTVETSREEFSWGKPKALALIEFAREKFGWTKLKSESVLKPVLARMEEKTHQKSIRDFFETRFVVHSDEAQKKMSKRVQTAVKNIGKDPVEILQEELQKKPSTSRRKKGKTAPEFESSGTEESSQPQVSVASTSSKVNLNKLKSLEVEDKIEAIRQRRKLKDSTKKNEKEKKARKPKEDSELKEAADLVSKVVNTSREKAREIQEEMMEELKKQTVKERPAVSTTRPKRESIPQRERDRTVLMRNKLKAIEVFRKGKHGPGYVPKKAKGKSAPKDDAGLSESSDD